MLKKKRGVFVWMGGGGRGQHQKPGVRLGDMVVGSLQKKKMKVFGLNGICKIGILKC